MLNAEELTPTQRYEHLLRVVRSERFLKMQGLGNEVPFFICPYPPQDAVAMEKHIRQLARRLAQEGIAVIEIDLYDLCMTLLRERGIWERVFEAETTADKEAFKELLQGVLDPEEHLIPAIAQILDQQRCDVLFITGVGEIYPYIRSHNVLNNLQSTATDHPTLMFFPGKYTHSLEAGASLDLFGLLHDDKYYRAFNIFHVEV